GQDLTQLDLVVRIGINLTMPSRKSAPGTEGAQPRGLAQGPGVSMNEVDFEELLEGELRRGATTPGPIDTAPR
ncbi:MAG TPA: hypothetical protein VGR08_06065, partial [Thermomicrobiales bacterium]|nr:hypothetical protein [Thermomicrobiales bacterium]